MAVAFGSDIITAIDTNNLQVFTTAALTNAPGAGRLVIGVVEGSSGADNPWLTSVTGGGMTRWDILGAPVARFDPLGSPSRLMCVIYAQQAAAGTTTALTLTFNKATSGMAVSVFDVTGMPDNIENNGRYCFTNVVTAATASATSITGSNLGTPFPGSLLFCGYLHGVASEAQTPRTNWTNTTATVGGLTPNTSFNMETTTTLEQSYGGSWTTSATSGAIAGEIVQNGVNLAPRQARMDPVPYYPTPTRLR